MKLDENLFEDVSSKYQVYLFTDKHKPVNEFENEEEAYKFCEDNGWKYCDKDGFCWFMDYKEQPISEDLDSQESRYFARELGNAISDVVYDYKDKGLSETELRKVIDDKVSSIVKRFKLSECISKEFDNLGESYSDYLDPQSEVGMFIREFAKSIINGKALTDKQQKIYNLISELVMNNIDESLIESEETVDKSTIDKVCKVAEEEVKKYFGDVVDHVDFDDFDFAYRITVHFKPDVNFKFDNYIVSAIPGSDGYANILLSDNSIIKKKYFSWTILEIGSDFIPPEYLQDINWIKERFEYLCAKKMNIIKGNADEYINQYKARKNKKDKHKYSITKEQFNKWREDPDTYYEEICKAIGFNYPEDTGYLDWYNDSGAADDDGWSEDISDDERDSYEQSALDWWVDHRWDDFIQDITNRFEDKYSAYIDESLTEDLTFNNKEIELIKKYLEKELGHTWTDKDDEKQIRFILNKIHNMDESLTEDVDDVVMIEVPDVIADIKETDITPKGPEVGVDTGIADMLLDLINGENDTIKDYNIFKANLESHPEFISAIEDITNEENNHVGMLQTLLKQISPNVETIKQGEAEAEKDLIDDSQSVEVSDFEVDDSFDNGFGGIYV